MDKKSVEKESGSFLSGVARAIDGAYAVTTWVLVLFVVLMCAVMLIQIVSRYLFNMPLTWPEEVARYLFIWVVFLGAAVAFRAQAHLGMDFATARLPERLRNVLSRAVEVLILGFLLLILYITPEVVEVTGFQRSAVINIQMSWIYLAFPVASLLMILDLFVRWFCPQPLQSAQD